MTVRIVPGFDAAGWGRLRPRAPLHDPAWLSVMGSRLPGELFTLTDGGRLGFCGVVVSDAAAYEAYNPCALLWRDPPVFELADSDSRRTALTRMVGGARATLPALVLVAPGYCGDPAGACADDPVAIQEFLSGVLGWCEEHGLAGLHILYTASPAVSEAVRGLGGASYPITSRFALPVWWDDWAGYLRGLPAKRAREVSREVRRAGESGAAPAVVDPASCFGALLAGRCDLLRRHGQEVDEAAERHRLHGLIAVFGGRLRVYGAVERGDVVASSVCLRHGKTMNVIFSGTTERGHMLPFAHFLATYYAPAMYSTRGELDEIDYGIGHGVGKLLRGCGARQLYAHAFGVGQQRHHALAQAVRLLAGGAGPGQGPAGPGRPAGPTQEKVRLSWT